MNKVAVLLLIALLSMGAGCRRHENASPDEARVRLINAVPNAGDLTVAVDGKRVWKGPRFGSNTGYQAIPKGRYEVRIDTGRPRPIDSAGIGFIFERGQDYTLVALPSATGGEEPGTLVFVDERNAFVPPGQASIRFINAAPGARRIDALFNRIVGLKNVALGTRSDALLLDTGDYELSLAPSASQFTPLLEPIPLHLESGRAYTFVAMGGRKEISVHAYQDR